jgi:radical SAM superfamily enzyme
MSMEEYVSLIKDCIDILPKEMIIHRMTGDGDKRTLVAPLWSADKKRVLNALHAALDFNGDK